MFERRRSQIDVNFCIVGAGYVLFSPLDDVKLGLYRKVLHHRTQMYRLNTAQHRFH